MRSGSPYEEGLDILLPLTTEAEASRSETNEDPAEEHVASADDSGKKEEAKEEETEGDGHPPEAMVVDELTSVTNAPPKLTPGVRIDVLVTVANREEIAERNLPVSPQGEIYLPLVKTVAINGLTRQEGIEKLIELYGKYFRNPEVEIIFSQFEGGEAVSPWGHVTVTGRVTQPRRIPLTASGKLTLSQAVTMAGGLSTSAKDKAVRITRKLDNGVIEKQIVNLRDIVSSGELEKDIVLQDGDIVFVPETLF